MVSLFCLSWMKASKQASQPIIGLKVKENLKQKRYIKLSVDDSAATFSFSFASRMFDQSIEQSYLSFKSIGERKEEPKARKEHCCSSIVFLMTQIIKRRRKRGFNCFNTRIKHNLLFVEDILLRELFS